MVEQPTYPELKRALEVRDEMLQKVCRERDAYARKLCELGHLSEVGQNWETNEPIFEGEKID